MTAAAIALGAAMFAAAPANAGDASFTGGTLTYTARDGEDNVLEVRQRQGYVLVMDEAGATAGSGCRQMDTTEVWCDGEATGATVAAGDGDDWVNFGWEWTVPLTADGGEGRDSLEGGAADDTLDGGDDDDWAAGQGGNDHLIGGHGSDIELRGDTGDDVIEGGEEQDALVGGEGDDQLFGGAGMDGLDGDENMGGGSGSGADMLDGGPDADYLDGGRGGDTIIGGDGSDTVEYWQRPEPLTITLDGLRGDGAVGEDDDIRGDVESVTGGAGPDVIVGNGGTNSLSGWEGADVLVGGGGGDSLDGDDGADRLFGGNGPLDVPAPASAGEPDAGDQLRGRLGDDSLDGGAGLDLYESDEGNDQIDAREPADGPPVGGESVFCGVGIDVALLDGDDQVDRCETADRIGRPAGEIPPPSTWFPTPGPAPQVPQQVDVDLVLDEPGVSLDDGLLKFKVRCVRRTGGTCKGSAAAASGSRRLATKPFSSRIGKRTTVKARLSRQARTLIRRRGRVKAKATIVVSVPGSPPVRWSRTITLKKGAL